MPYDIFLDRMEHLASEKGLTLINCIRADGENDFSILPALPPEPVNEQSGDDIPFDDDDDKEEDEEEDF